MKKVLIIDRDQTSIQTIKSFFMARRIVVFTATSATTAIDLWQTESPCLIFLDIHDTDLKGCDILARVKTFPLLSDVVAIASPNETEILLKALRLGAIDCLHRPITYVDLEIVTEKLAARKRKRRKIKRLTSVISETFKPKQIIGRSKGILNVVGSIVQASKEQTNVLIEGERGTGKELVARTIHYQSRPFEPFIGINCTSILVDFLENELFGYEKGAFTGASQRRIGRLEYAGEGTVFLDEISELPHQLQSKFLNVLVEKKFQRLGSLEEITLQARVIAATNKKLDELVKTGDFKEELYSQFKGLIIKIPPLRERREDIVPLVEYFVNQLNLELHKKVKRIPKDHMDALTEYDWPGNVRELKTVLRRAMILTDGEVLEFDPGWLQGEKKKAPESGFNEENGEPKKLVEVEKEHIGNVLKYTRGNYGEACRILGISRPTLRKKIKDYNLQSVQQSNN